MAAEALESGHREVGRDALLKACNFYRESQYMVFDEGRRVGMMERSVGCFERAMPLMEYPVKKVGIPFEGVVLPGYFYLPPTGKRVAGKIPIIISCNGADSAKEELHFISAASAPAQGYAVLTVDGPRQGMSLLKIRRGRGRIGRLLFPRSWIG